MSLVRPMALMLVACAPSSDFMEAPFVQASSTKTPRWTVDINRVRDGIYRSYAPRCLDSVSEGHTIEFRNFLPEVPANVTSIGEAPEPLYSPNLMRPYNYVSATDESNSLCDSPTPDGCAVRPSYSYWRFTFEQAGTYDWIDTNQGSPGRQVTDPYYGTVTFVGLDPNTPFGTVCVEDAGGGGCAGVCCVTDSDCSGGTRCFKTAVDATGRCLTPSG
jgi:hypothetical protein